MPAFTTRRIRPLNAFDTQSVDIAMTRSTTRLRYSGSLNTFSLNARTRQLEVLLVNRAYKDFKSDDNGRTCFGRRLPTPSTEANCFLRLSEHGDRRLHADSFRHLPFQ